MKDIIERANNLRGKVDCKHSDFKKWKRDSKICINNIFHNEDYNKQFDEIQYHPGFYDNRNIFTTTIAGLDDSLAMLHSMLDEIEKYHNFPVESKLTISLWINAILLTLIAFQYFYYNSGFDNPISYILSILPIGIGFIVQFKAYKTLINLIPAFINLFKKDDK